MTKKFRKSPNLVTLSKANFITTQLTRNKLAMAGFELSTVINRSTGKNKLYGNILLEMTSVVSIMVDHFDCKSCLVEKNVPKAFILPSRWQDAAESLGVETTNCLWSCGAWSNCSVNWATRILCHTEVCEFHYFSDCVWHKRQQSSLPHSPAPEPVRIHDIQRKLKPRILI